MYLAENILAQGKGFIYIDGYQFDNDELISFPKFENIPDDAYISISMWMESICQNGEIMCRLKVAALNRVILVNVGCVEMKRVKKKEAENIVYKTKIVGIMKNYIKSAITVLYKGESLFECNCTHFFE